MTDIILLGVICFGLAMYCLYLQTKIRFLERLLLVSVQTMHELADGTMEVKRVDGKVKLSSAITSGDRYES
jgi:hypothetical protein